MRLLSTHKGERPDFLAKVYRDAEWNEYRVKFYENGVYLAEADYHTDDKADAEGTAISECNRIPTGA